MSANNCTLTNANQEIRKYKIALRSAYVVKEAIQKKQANIPHEYFKLFFEKIKQYIISDIIRITKQPVILETIIGVDGTLLNVLNNLDNDKFSKILLSSVYNLSNNIPLDTVVNLKINEQQTFLTQIKYIPNNSILVGDGHYCTYEIMKQLNNKNINFVFKFPKTYTICKEFIESNETSKVIKLIISLLN